MILYRSFIRPTIRANGKTIFSQHTKQVDNNDNNNKTNNYNNVFNNSLLHPHMLIYLHQYLSYK